ncbi:MAG: SprT-like domain-containing protein [Candidatus Cryptobacteroides sp.]
MVATVEYVKERFDHFNSLCFLSALKPVRIELMRSRTQLGQLRYRRHRKVFGGWRYSDFTLRISSALDMDEALLEDTILHEMIHYCILSSQKQDSSAHGVLFRQMMDELNTSFGRHITISHRKTEAEKDADLRRREHIVCVTRLQPDRLFVTVCARTACRSIRKALSSLDGIVEQKWYSSTDPYFNRYPHSRTPKLYAVKDRDALARALQDSPGL